MAPRIVNPEYYYALKNRIHRFNVIYRDKLMYLFGERDLLREEDFSKIGDVWEDIAREHSKDIYATNLEKDEVISEDNFKLLKEAAEHVCGILCRLAVDKDLGEEYEGNDGLKYRDYTYISHEIFEMCLLALHTYTNIFKQCDHMKLHYSEPETGRRRAEEIADAIYPADKRLPVFETQYKTRQMLDRPIDNVWLEIAKKLHTEDNYTVIFGENLDRVPYIEVKKSNDKARQARNDAIDREIAQKKQERRQKFEEQERRAEEEANAWRDRNKGKHEDVISFEEARDFFSVAPNEDPPGERKAHFYAMFAERGIDESVFTAETILQEVHYANHLANLKRDNEVFQKKIKGIYRALQAHMYQKSVEEMIEGGVPINLNLVSKRADEIMAAAFYTVDPEGFAKGDENTKIRAAQLLDGAQTDEERAFSEVLRSGAIKYVKEQYRAKGIAHFNMDAEKIYDELMSGSRSSGKIAKDMERSAREYSAYMVRTQNGTVGVDERENAIMRKLTMDDAYALEKRVETRYATRAARFFRFLSYRKQVKALEKIKQSLGIDKTVRVADVYVDDRLNHIFIDSSDPKRVGENRIHFTKQDGKMALDYVKSNLKKAIPGKPLPKVEIPEEKPNENIFSKQNAPEPLPQPAIEDILDKPGDVTTTHSEQLKEKLRIEEEEKRELERIENERIKRKEEEFRLEQERIEQQRLEMQEREEKEDLYNEKVDTLELQVERAEQKYKDSLDASNKKKVILKDRLSKIPNRLSYLEADKDELLIAINGLFGDLKKLGIEMTESVEKNAAKDTKKKGKKGKEQADNTRSVEEIEKELRETRDCIAEKNISLEDVNGQIDAIWLEEKKLRAEIDAPGAECLAAWEELKKVKDELQFFKDNKEEIIKTGKRLDWKKDTELSREDYCPRESVMRASNWQPSGRETIILDDDEPSNVSMSEPVDDAGRESQISISK